MCYQFRLWLETLGYTCWIEGTFREPGLGQNTGSQVRSVAFVDVGGILQLVLKHAKP